MNVIEERNFRLLYICFERFLHLCIEQVYFRSFEFLKNA